MARPHRLAALLAAREASRADGKLGCRHHPADRADQADLLSALRGELQVDGENETRHATPYQDPRDVWRRSPEDEPGDDGALSDREDQPAGRLLSDPGADSRIHRALLGAARGDRAAPRALHTLDQIPICARPLFLAPAPHV